MKVLAWVLGTLFLLIFWSSESPTSYDPGIGWHIRGGELIAATGKVLRPDPFLAETNIQKGFPSSAPWVQNQWFADWTFYLIQSHAGWQVLDALALIACLISLCLCVSKDASFSARMNKDSLLFLGIFLLAALSMQLFWLERPVVISFVLFAIAISSGSRISWWKTILLFCLWANVHPTYPLALVVWALQQLEPQHRSRRGIINLILGSAATLINPYGINLAVVSFGLAIDRSASARLVEWTPTPLDETFFPFWALLALTFVLSLRRQNRVSVPLVVLAAFAVLSRRFVPYAALMAVFECCSFLGSSNFSPVFPTKVKAAKILFTTVALVLLLTACVPGLPQLRNRTLSVPDSSKPLRLVHMIQPQGGRCLVLNDPNLGGFIVLKKFPECKVFADDRYEVTGAKRYEFYYRVLNAELPLETISREVAPTHIILKTKSPGATRLENDGRVSPVAAEGDYSLFVLN